MSVDATESPVPAILSILMLCLGHLIRNSQNASHSLQSLLGYHKFATRMAYKAWGLTT